MKRAAAKNFAYIILSYELDDQIGSSQPILACVCVLFFCQGIFDVNQQTFTVNANCTAQSKRCANNKLKSIESFMIAQMQTVKYSACVRVLEQILSLVLFA